MIDCKPPASTYVVDLIRLAVRSVPVFSDLPVIDMRLDALEATLESSIDRITDLKSQITSKDAAIVTKMAQVDSLDGRLRIAEEGRLLLSASMH